MNKKNFDDLKVALVYDHLTTPFGGAELVLQTLLELFPSAPIFTSVYEMPTNNWAKNFDVRTSFLQRIPILRKHHQLLAPLHPLAFESHVFHEYDVIISVSNGPAKGVLTLPHQLHVCYLLTPTRYLADDTEESKNYLKSQPLFSIPGFTFITKPFFSYLKRWDTVAAWRPDYIVAISRLVAERSQRVYNRKADSVIYPPFKNSNLTHDPLPIKNFLLCLTRLTSYKRVDVAIKAAIHNDRTLVIAGDGVHKKKLRTVAGKHAYLRTENQTLEETLNAAETAQQKIIFMGTCTEREKQLLLANCQALVMPGEEDFGLVGLEAAAHGKPVITHAKSGIAEVLLDKSHGVHLKQANVSALSEAIQKLEELAFSESELKKTANKHDSTRFKESFSKTIYQFWQQHSTISPVGQ